MYNVAVCSGDNQLADLVLQDLVGYGIEKEKISFFRYESAIQFDVVKNYAINFQLIVIEYEMYSLEALNAIKHLKLMFPKAVFAIYAGKNELTLDLLDIMPFRCFIKGNRDKNIKAKIAEVIDEMQRRGDDIHILAFSHSTMIRLVPDEIMYIANAKRGSSIYVNSKLVKYNFSDKLTSNQKLRELYDLLSQHGFIYVHNSYIVNMRYVRLKTLTELQMVDGTILSIARSKEKEFRQAFVDYSLKTQ